MPGVRALGERHAGYRISAVQFAPVGPALLWTLEQRLGNGLQCTFQHHDRRNGDDAEGGVDSSSRA